MKMKEKLENRELNMGKTLLSMAVLSLFLSLFQVFMQIGSGGFASFLDAFSPVTLLINSSLYFLFLSFFLFLFGKLSVSFVIVSVLTQLLLIVNYYKIYFLSVPLKASDLILGKEATGIIGNYKLNISFYVVFLSLAMIFICIQVVRLLKNKKITFFKRSAGLILTLTVAFFGYTYFYSNSKIYENVVFATNEFSEVDVVNGHGFLYSLINGISKTKYKKPDGYNKEEVAKVLTKDTSLDTPPNVIAIMSEAFFDIREARYLRFKKNPLPNYTKLRKEGIYGDIIVPGFAGNTSSSEFEFLTGVNISLIDKGMPVPYKTFMTKKAYALPQYFNELGFSTVAMHPGHNWFYNRVLAYNCMGFSRSVFLENLSYKPEMTNYYANDSETAKMIIDDYSSHLDKNGNKGYFNFTVTIQNHGPYMSCDTEREEVIKRLYEMDDTAYYTIDNYVQGLMDADNLLKTIKDYIETVDKPTVVVFFGDHLPFLDSELKYYDIIGYDITSGTEEALLRKHKTPFLIFSNTAFKESEKAKGNKVLRGKRGVMSSSFLATELFSYMNVSMPPYFEYVNSLKEDINVIFPYYYKVNDEFTYELSLDLNEKIRVLKNLQYYNIMEYKK